MSTVSVEQSLFTIGPIQVTGFAIEMGLFAALITMPVKMFIVLCFSGSRQRSTRNKTPVDQTTDRYLIKADNISPASSFEIQETKHDNDKDKENDTRLKGWRYVFT